MANFFTVAGVFVTVWKLMELHERIFDIRYY